jgi:hypothetical protein
VRIEGGRGGASLARTFGIRRGPSRPGGCHDGRVRVLARIIGGLLQQQTEARGMMMGPGGRSRSTASHACRLRLVQGAH